MTTPPVCDYEGSDYQTSFWDQGGRQYEDLAETIALKRLLPAQGKLLLELGAGAGRNTPRYKGFEQIVLLDYSRTQLQQARERLGTSPKYIYVAADIYKMPFVDGLFDSATMIRTLHHMKEAPKALAQVRRVLKSGAFFLLEYANKLNLKAILRYWTGKQAWNPFSPEPVEFVALNFDFHPTTIRQWLKELGFEVQKVLTVSHFRIGLLKRIVPAKLLANLDGLIQPTGAWFQFTPSVFVGSTLKQTNIASLEKNYTGDMLPFFQCPECSQNPLKSNAEFIECPQCGSRWAIRDGIYDFREPLT